MAENKAVEAVEAVTDAVKNVAISAKKAAKPKANNAAAAAKSGSGPARALELDPKPDFLESRIALFDRLYAKQQAELAQRPRVPITVTMPDGSVKEGLAWETTPGDIAKGISNSLYKRTVVAQLNGEELWDLDRPLEASCKLELLPFDHPEGKKVFWHSSAHILGEACERRFGCSLCIGPPVDNGFYYEMSLPDQSSVVEDDYKPLESIVTSIVKEKQKFQRLVMTKEELLEMFRYNKYKQHIISDKIPDGTSTTVYRNGPLIDLCRGPHVPDTSRVEAFTVTKASASYFLGDQNNDTLQRVYGISFPDKKQLAAYKKFLEEAAKRDHRKIGVDQELFYFDSWSPGSAFFLPHGTRVYNTILEYLRNQYWKRGYDEVITPNMYNTDLWRQSGHWRYYKEDMFSLEADKEKARFALKPMNCPGHCLMFGMRERSYRELPMRIADFGVLHRNEASGALSGLTRVRRFQQDDAHIFCQEDQIGQEVDGLFDFFREVYMLLGFTYKLKLSTRPEKFLGDLGSWNRAEEMLKESLDRFAKANDTTWEINEGDGAFYGPKIDIQVFDCLQRPFQTATIQLDFVNPINFNLEYAADTSAAHQEEGQPSQSAMAEVTPEWFAGQDMTEGEFSRWARRDPVKAGYKRPVIIHRAMAGSIERFMGILIEHFAGKWPFWLSPRQIMVIPVGKGFIPYAQEVRDLFHADKFYVDVDTSGETLQKKVRRAQLAQYNFIFIVGDEEERGRQVNIRFRDDTSAQDRGKPVGVEETLVKLKGLRADYGYYNPFAEKKEDKTA